MTQSNQNTETNALTDCWTDAEVDALVEDLKIEKDKAIDDAVKLAVIPILIENEALKYERDTYKNNFEEMKIMIEQKESANKLEIFLYCTGTGIVATVLTYIIITFTHK